MLQHAASVDVAIIGAGIMGVATAAHLTSAGASVAVFETHAVASGASGRNLGTILHPLEPALTPLFAPSLKGYRDLAAELPRWFGLPAEPVGLLMLGWDATAVQARAAEIGAAYPDLRPRVVDPRELEPGLARGLHGCLVETAFPAEPASATTAFAERARRAGARIEIGRRAAPVIRRGRAIGVNVGDDFVAAETVLVAAGHDTATIVDPTGTWKPISPLWGVTVQVDLRGSIPRVALSELFPDDEAATAAMFNLTTSEAADGTLATALGATFSAAEPDPAAVAPTILERGARYLPALADATITATRSCARPVSADGAPLLGPVAGVDGLHVAGGLGPWGISLGPAAAELAAAAILGRSDVPEAYAASRFPL